MSRTVRRLLCATDGAVAPTVAISLVGLIVSGGIAFDYARMASLDTEMQSAADQAALAAASQLDGAAGACARASAAAVGMITNRTVMANEPGGVAAVTVTSEPACDATGSIRFYQNLAKTIAATSDANAKFVEVRVDPRRTYYALTPIVAARYADVSGVAYAGLGEAYCKTPPVMICNPQETSTNTDFTVSSLVGKGLRLVTVGDHGGWVPGNFGYLNTNGGSNGTPGLREALGWSTPPGDCIEANGVDTKPGAAVTVTDTINTRFDIYDGTNSCPTGGLCPASVNSVKDVQRSADASGNNACKMHNSGWGAPANYYGDVLPTSATTPLASTDVVSAMGHPRDMCHAAPSSASGYCSGPIGDGNWDRDAYFRTNYGWTGGAAGGSWQAYTGLPATAKRYDVYLWEIANRGRLIGGKIVLGPSPAGATGSTKVAYGESICSASEGMGAPVVPGGAVPDRRKFTVAVVNCLEEGVNGNSTAVDVKQFIDVFLVEPSRNRTRTSAGDVYVEVIGTSGNTTSAAVQQVKKAVPYLIE